MCYVHLKKEQLQQEHLLTTEQWKNLMKQAIDNGMRYATLSGGECLIHPGFEELYRYLQSYGIRVTVMTNGLLLKERIRLFQEYPPREIQISVYGSNEAGYWRVTGHRVFSRVMESIRLAKEARLPLSLAITPSRFMEPDVEELVRLVASLEIPYTINSGLFDPNEDTGRKGQPLDMSREMYFRTYRLSTALKGRTVTPKCEAELPPAHTEGMAAYGLRCGAGRNLFAINWDGRMAPCSMLWCEPQYPLQSGFMECWETVHQFALQYPIPAECDGCRYQKACQHCVAKHAQGAPLGHANPALCADGKRLAAEGLVSI